MNRLIQGTGSGKTVLAAAAAWAICLWVSRRRFSRPPKSSRDSTTRASRRYFRVFRKGSCF
jgi:hypothetical protein